MAKEKNQTKSCLFRYEATDHNTEPYYLKSTSSTRALEHSSDVKQLTAETLRADGKWRNGGLLYANFHGCCAQYLANETELGQNILHTNYWW